MMAGRRFAHLLGMDAVVIIVTMLLSIVASAALARMVLETAINVMHRSVAPAATRQMPLSERPESIETSLRH
jgi:hypothetical protein